MGEARIVSCAVDGMKAYFEQFGQVTESHIMKDPTGKSRCFGFVNFADGSVLDAVLQKTHILDSKQVCVPGRWSVWLMCVA